MCYRCLKIASKTAIQKTVEATGEAIGNKILIELRKFQKPHKRIIQKQMKKKNYLEKDIYLQNKDRKLLMI